MFFLSLAGCTDKIRYKHTADPNEIIVEYTEGVGNSTKTAIKVTLSDNTKLEVGNSTTDQDELMRTMREAIDKVDKLILLMGI